MKLLPRKLREIPSMLGWRGMAGMALLLAAIAAHLLLANVMSARLNAMQNESLSLKSRIAQAAKGGFAAAGSAEEMQRFQAYFSGATPSAWLQKIHAAATANGLALDRGEYRDAPVQAGRLVRYQVTLPVRASYPQIRRFVDQVLADVPVAAVDDISFKRDSIGDTQLEARVRLSLFIGANK